MRSFRPKAPLPPHTQTHERRHPHRRGGGGRRRHPGLADHRKMHGENFFCYLFPGEGKKRGGEKILKGKTHDGGAAEERRRGETGGDQKRKGAKRSILLLCFALLC